MFDINDEVTVICDDNCGFGKGVSGVIVAISDDGLYEVDAGQKYNCMYSDDELELTQKSSDQSKMNLESKVEINDNNETKLPNGFHFYDVKEIDELKATIASLESELLTAYRELHRQNKDS